MKMKITWLVAGLFVAMGTFIGGSAAAQCDQGEILVVKEIANGKKQLARCLPEAAAGGQKRLRTTPQGRP